MASCQLEKPEKEDASCSITRTNNNSNTNSNNNDDSICVRGVVISVIEIILGLDWVYIGTLEVEWKQLFRV